ncbi:hypothetical protein [Halobaculum litoreum]|uniref:hypothetical protein n=1 Tax=Halobaculum litoreum TaxID=3031998 RepID=UPI0024C42BEA|nr:hypothetical protein [Halobaculum sp. DT92]
MDSGEAAADGDAGADADAATDAADAAGGRFADGESPDERLADALERVAHGAVVSTPSILLQRGLALAFTALLTNTFAAGPYGLFALARRLQRFLRRLALGFAGGLSRFLPTTETAAERDAIATFAVALVVAVAALFGAALYVAAPTVAARSGEAPRFALYLRVFAVGLPASVALFAVARLMRATEEVTALNLLQRLAFPAAQLVVGAVGAVVLGDLVGVAVGVPLAMGVVALGGAAWLARSRGFRPGSASPTATPSGGATSATRSRCSSAASRRRPSGSASTPSSRCSSRARPAACSRWACSSGVSCACR